MGIPQQILDFPSRVRNWGHLVRFSHTVFALPFALSIVVYLGARSEISTSKILLILLCTISARTAAMAFNRLLDRDIDAKNPRTFNRELPAGVLSIREVRLLTIVSVLTFILGAAMLGQLCLYLSPIVLAVLLGYSYTKRFTSLSHLVLGLALALAPGGVWIALANQFAWLPVWMMLGVLLWVAGFDILYSCQDFEFDKKSGLFSIPARVGLAAAFNISRLFHFLAVGFLVLFGVQAEMGPFYFMAVAIFAGLLVSQHRIISPHDLRRIDQAFFTRNGVASVVYFIGVVVDTMYQL